MEVLHCSGRLSLTIIDFSDSGKAVDKILKLITHHYASLTDPSVVTAKRKNKRNVYVSLTESSKNNDYSDGNGINENYRLKRMKYHFKLRKFLSQLKAEKITELCNAADSNEKLFWMLLKGQRSTSQMTAFLVDGKQIREMWVDHFEALGTPSVSFRYDNDFLIRVTISVNDILSSCTEDPSGVLNGPLQYYEVEQVC